MQHRVNETSKLVEFYLFCIVFQLLKQLVNDGVFLSWQHCDSGRSINRNFYFALWDGELTHVPLCGIKRQHFFNAVSIHIKSDSLYSNSNNTIAISKLHSIELVDRIDGLADGLMLGVPIAIGVTITSFYLGLSWDAYIAGEISYWFQLLLV